MRNRIVCSNRLATLALAGTLAFAALPLAACGGGSATSSTSDSTVDVAEDAADAAEGAAQSIVDKLTSGAESVTIKSSPDKYTWYIKDYTNMNAASVGYTALDTRRHETYGAGNMVITFVADDGAFLDPENEDILKDYVVYDQNLEPNTEIKYTFMLDEEGEEYDNLVAWQNIDEIVLAVHKVGESEGVPSAMTAITPAPDRYTGYVKDYVGRNLAACGYVSLAENLTDTCGGGYVTFDITASDGSYVDPTDAEALTQYVVIDQSVAANTPVTMTYLLDSDGNEYDNLIDTQSIESVALTVAPLQ